MHNSQLNWLSVFSRNKTFHLVWFLKNMQQIHNFPKTRCSNCSDNLAWKNPQKNTSCFLICKLKPNCSPPLLIRSLSSKLVVDGGGYKRPGAQLLLLFDFSCLNCVQNSLQFMLSDTTEVNQTTQLSLALLLGSALVRPASD